MYNISSTLWEFTAFLPVWRRPQDENRIRHSAGGKQGWRTNDATGWVSSGTI